MKTKTKKPESASAAAAKRSPGFWVPLVKAPKKAKVKTAGKKTAKKPVAPQPEAETPATAAPKATSKKDAILALMGRAEGVSAKEIMQVTGWQAHTVRGFIATLREKGYTVCSTHYEDLLVYSMQGSPAVA